MQENILNLPWPVKKVVAIKLDLENRGLIIDSKYDIFNVLGKFGYENVILKYSSSFLDSFQNYKIGTKFSDIVDLFFFDLDLRKEVFSIMQLFEFQLKTAMIDTISFNISSQYDIYMKSDNFKEKYEYRNKKEEVLFSTTRKWLRKRLKHYRNKAKKELTAVEMIQKLYFHEVEDWYFLLHKNLKDKVALYMSYGPAFEEFQDISVNDSLIFLDPMINLYRGFRNQAAHEGVIYNYYNPEIKFPYNAYCGGEELIPNDKKYHCGIGILLLLSYMLDPTFLYKRFDKSLESLITHYLSIHPNQHNIVNDMGLDRVHILTKDNKYLNLLKK